MRSRYTAYVRRDAQHLLRTWHHSAAVVPFLGDGVWLGLEVLTTDAGGADDATGGVTFVARYQLPGGSLEELRETSRFVRERGEWLYLDDIE